MKSQTERILAHLRVAPITPLEALKYADCLRLGARIYDLREAGHKIDTVMVQVSGRTPKWVAKYVLRKEAR